MMFITFFSCLLLFYRHTLADPLFLSPTPGENANYKNFTISWLQNGIDDLHGEFSRYEIQLCAGGNKATNYVNLTSVVSSNSYPKPQSTSVAVPRHIGNGSISNAYFLKFISYGPSNFSITNFSPRFSLPGLNGAFPAKVVAGLQTVQGSLVGPQSYVNGTAPTAAELDHSLSRAIIAAITVVAVVVAAFACFTAILVPHLRRRRQPNLQSKLQPQPPPAHRL